MAQSTLEVLSRPVVNKQFGSAIIRGELSIPLDYDHDMQIDASIERVKKTRRVTHHNPDFCSKNFVSLPLLPGRAYGVEIIPILSRVLCEDCVLYHKNKKAILAGGHGITLLNELSPNLIPRDLWVVSFDHKTFLWDDPRVGYRVPMVFIYKDEAVEYDLGSFKDPFDEGSCLLVLKFLQ